MLQGTVVTPSMLLEAVDAHGGYAQVVAGRRWQRVREFMGIPLSTNSGKILGRAYKKFFQHGKKGTKDNAEGPKIVHATVGRTGQVTTRKAIAAQATVKRTNDTHVAKKAKVVRATPKHK